MGRHLLLPLILCTPAWAIEPCEPPPGAQPAPMDVGRLHAAAVAANRYPTTIALAPATCVSRLGIFVDATLVPPADRAGPAARAPALAVLGWLLGVHQFTFGGPRTDATADQAGARFAGCALAHVGARGNDLTAQVQHLEAATAPHADPHAF
ncbi:MAG: hypothetical protein R3F60_33655, partial [bacterium]